MNSLYKSSTGSEDISLTIKGIVTAFIPLIIIIGKQYGWEITENSIADFLTVILGAISAVQLAWGTLRKVYIAIKKVVS